MAEEKAAGEIVAAWHLMECASLAGSIPDSGPFETHKAYAARLKAGHGRKSCSGLRAPNSG